MMPMCEDPIVIAGVGQVPVGEHWQRTLRSIAAEAVKAALKDSGCLRPRGLFIGNALAPILSHQTNLGALIADACGLIDVETFCCEAAGASGGAAVRAAYLAVKSGCMDCAIALGVEKITENTGSVASEAQDLMLNYEYETMMGMTLPSGAALLARRYLVEYDLDREVLDCMSLTAYGQAALNPNAFHHLKLTADSLKKQAVSNAPLGLYNCSVLADGAAALVITRESCLKEPGKAVYILGSGNAVDALSLHDRHNLLSYNACNASAVKAFRNACVTPEQIDIWELWDAYSIDAILAREAIGLAPLGEGWKADCRYYSCMGGCLGRGNPLGASGAYQMVEAALQLRGDAGNCQISNPRTAFVQSVGGLGSTAVTHILAGKN